MNKTLLILIGFVLGSGGGATWLALGQHEPAAVAAALPTHQPLPPQLEEVLVATHKLSSGSVIQASDLAWQGWPRDTALKGVIRKAEAPAAMDEIKDSVLRGALIAGEPIRREKLAKGGNTGDPAGVLAPGHRAVAIPVEGGGATADGASILPNDRVDVSRVTRDKNAVRSGKTLVENVRVLAIGQNAQDKRSQTSATGAIAILELDARQAETILAQHGAELSLALSSRQDAHNSAPVVAFEDKRDTAVAVVRAGR
jgi:pilus assembly protein CpaB